VCSSNSENTPAVLDVYDLLSRLCALGIDDVVRVGNFNFSAIHFIFNMFYLVITSFSTLTKIGLSQSMIP